MNTVKVKKPTCKWIDLRDHWEEIQQLSFAREQQKKKFTSKNYGRWDDHGSHLVGLCGEFIVSLETNTKIDTELYYGKQGDKGYDLLIDRKTYSIKTTTYFKNPFLKEYLRPKHFCDFYILVGVDIPKKRGKIFGWCSQADIKAAEIIDWGHGPQRSIDHKKLRKW